MPVEFLRYAREPILVFTAGAQDLHCHSKRLRHVRGALEVRARADLGVASEMVRTPLCADLRPLGSRTFSATVSDCALFVEPSRYAREPILVFTAARSQARCGTFSTTMSDCAMFVESLRHALESILVSASQMVRTLCADLRCRRRRGYAYPRTWRPGPKGWRVRGTR